MSVSFIDGTRVSKINGSLRVGGPAQQNATLTVYGALTAPSATITGPLTVGSNFTVDGSGNMLALTATFNGLATIAGALSGTGANFQNNLTVGGTLAASSYSVADPAGGNPLPGVSGNAYYSTSSFSVATFQNGLLVGLA